MSGDACEHGSSLRKCEYCENAALLVENARLEKRLARAEDLLRSAQYCDFPQARARIAEYFKETA